MPLLAAWMYTYRLQPNGTPCGCASLASLDDIRGVPFSMCPQFVVHPDDGI